MKNNYSHDMNCNYNHLCSVFGLGEQMKLIASNGFFKHLKRVVVLLLMFFLYAGAWAQEPQTPHVTIGGSVYGGGNR